MDGHYLPFTAIRMVLLKCVGMDTGLSAFFCLFWANFILVCESVRRKNIDSAEGAVFFQEYYVFPKVFRRCFRYNFCKLYRKIWVNTISFQILSAKHLAETLTVSWKNFNALKSRLDYGVFLLLVLNPCLILLDNIHFQYNSLLYSMLFYSIASILNRNYIKVIFETF